MPVVAISGVRNEIDIIEPFVRHTLALVDHLVVLDNGSTDGTLDLLRNLERDGLPLVVVEDPTPGYLQAQRMTRLMHEYAVDRFAADWIVPLDADEFPFMPDGVPLVPTDLPAERPVLLPWRTYVPDPRDDPADPNPITRIRHHLVEEPKSWFKVMVPGKLARHPDSSLAMGNHSMLRCGQEMQHARAEHALIAHFPGRSATQLLAKIAIGYLQLTAMKKKNSGWVYHYSAPFELIKQDPAGFASSYRDIILRYTLHPEETFTPQLVDDPVPYAGGKLHYTAQAVDRSGGLKAILNYADGLAEHYADALSRLKNLEEDRLREVQTLQQAQAQTVARLEQLCEAGHHQVHDLQAALEAVKSSRTWRVGRALVGPAGRLLRSLGWKRPPSARNAA